MKKIVYIIVFVLQLFYCINAQNSMVGDGFGGRLWYKPTNYTVGSYTGYNICYDGPCPSGDYQLYGWGSNNSGQLGYDVALVKGVDTPTPIPGMKNVKYYSCGYSMGVIKNDNSGWVFGEHWPGIAPKKIIDDAKFVDASSNTISFVKTDGTVWTVGTNATGSFGDGTFISSYDTPVQMYGITNAVRVANSLKVTFVLLSDGTVKSVGKNENGFLGIGSSDFSKIALKPLDVLGLTNIVDIKATRREVMALDDKGDVYIWGNFATKPYKLPYNHIVAISGCDDGEVFFVLDKDHTCFQVNTIFGISIPAEGIPDVIDIMAGETFGYLVKSDGSLWGIGGSLKEFAPGYKGSIWMNLPSEKRESLTKITPEDIGACSTYTIPFVPIETSKPILCAGESTTLSIVPEGPYTYTWSTGAVSNDIIVTPSITTTYSIAVNNGTCTTTGERIIRVNHTPTLTVNSFTICSGQSATISAIGVASKYSWSSGEKTSDIVVSPLSTQIYSVTASVEACPESSETSTVTVVSNPTLSILSPTICSGKTTTLTSSGADTYTWSTGALTSTISVTPIVKTNYTITGEYSLTGCKETKTITVNVLANPILSINSPTICVGQATLLNVSGADSYTWSSGANTNSINVSPTTSTSYTVYGTNAEGCESFKTTTVTVSPYPVIVVNSDTICFGHSSDLISTGADTYSWSTGSTTNSIHVTPTSTTIYTVTGTNISGCNSTASSTVLVYNTEISVNSSTICFGQSASLNASGVNSYTWSTGEQLSSIIVTPTITNSYTVEGTDSFGCKTSQTTTVEVSHPIADFNGISKSIYLLSEGASLELINQSSGADNYSWSLCNSSFSENKDAYLSLTDTGYCCIKLIARKESCIDSITKCFYVECDPTILIPNVFTPNGDKVNDEFKIKSSCLKTLNCTIFDRWGLKLFEWDGIDGYWDGKASTGLAPTGTYYYILRYTNLKGIEKTEKGFLTLFKD